MDETSTRRRAAFLPLRVGGADGERAGYRGVSVRSSAIVNRKSQMPVHGQGRDVGAIPEKMQIHTESGIRRATINATILVSAGFTGYPWAMLC
jgi:hypothetical protein